MDEVKEEVKVDDVVKEEEVKEAPKPAEPQPEVKEVKEPIKEESAVDIMLKKQAELEAKLAELEARNAELEAKRKEIDAQSKIEKAKADGWLLPSMLVEDEAGKPSVFVDLAKEMPEYFDRLRLVMAPKSVPKKLITEAPVDNTPAVMSDDEKFARISAVAKDKGISYAEASKEFMH